MRTDDELQRGEAERLLERLGKRADRERRRARLRRAAGAAASIAVVGAGLAWSLGALSALDPDRGRGGESSPSPTVDGDTYVIEFLGLVDTGASEDQIGAKIRYSWSSDTFPGVRDCELLALDPSGEVIGRHTVRLPFTMDRIQEVSQELPADGPVETVEGSCGPRLDVGDPYAYSVDDAWARRVNDGIEVGVEAKWQGSEVPGVVRCRFAAFDARGHVLASKTDIPWPVRAEGYWFVDWKPDQLLAPLPEGGEPILGQVTCLPFVDGHEDFPPLEDVPLAQPVPLEDLTPSGTGWTYSDVVAYQSLNGWLVTYRLTWENGVYPGERDCTLRLRDDSGNVLFEDTIDGWTSMQPVTQFDQAVDRKPATFERICGERLDTPEAYLISDPVLEAGGHTISFQLDRPDHLSRTEITSNQCLAALVVDGEIAAISEEQGFGGVPPGRYEMEIDPGQVDTVRAVPFVYCEPFDGDSAGLEARLRAAVAGT